MCTISIADEYWDDFTLHRTRREDIEEKGQSRIESYLAAYSRTHSSWLQHYSKTLEKDSPAAAHRIMTPDNFELEHHKVNQRIRRESQQVEHPGVSTKEELNFPYSIVLAQVTSWEVKTGRWTEAVPVGVKKIVALGEIVEDTVETYKQRLFRAIWTHHVHSNPAQPSKILKEEEERARQPPEKQANVGFIAPNIDPGYLKKILDNMQGKRRWGKSPHKFIDSESPFWASQLVPSTAASSDTWQSRSGKKIKGKDIRPQEETLQRGGWQPQQSHNDSEYWDPSRNLPAAWKKHWEKETRARQQGAKEGDGSQRRASPWKKWGPPTEF